MVYLKLEVPNLYLYITLKRVRRSRVIGIGDSFSEFRYFEVVELRLALFHRVANPIIFETTSLDITSTYSYMLYNNYQYS